MQDQSAAGESIFSNLDPEFVVGLLQTYGIPVVKAIVLLLLALLVSRWAGRLTVRAAGRANVEITLAKFFGTLVRWGILLLAGIAILGFFGVETTSFAAVLAALGFAIGMALSGSLGNVAAGVMLLIFRPFKVGDVVSTAGVTGKVDELGLFATTFDTPDNRRIIVPNGGIFGSTIENISYHDTRRVDIAVGVDYGADIRRTREVLTQAAHSVANRRTDMEPAIVLGDLGDSAVTWSVRIWCDASEYWGVKESATEAVKNHLDEAGIGIPFPQMDVHVVSAPPGAGA